MATPTTGRLHERIALVTGAASGMGLRTTELFVAEGAHVIALDVSEADSQHPQPTPLNVTKWRADVPSGPAIESVMDMIRAPFRAS